MPPGTEATATLPRLSIVIPTYNGLSVLRECLASVERFRPRDAEVIVVDDCSSDGTAAWCRANYPAVRLVYLAANRGFCGAINAGLRVARAPVVETLNNDTVVTPNWAEPALALFADPSVGSVAPLVWLLEQPGIVDSAGDRYHVCGWARNRAHCKPLSAELQVGAEVFGASASAAFYRRDALVRVGLFPEHYRAYSDDVDVAFRLRWAGYRCVYTPDSQVYHYLHHTYRHTSDKTLRQLFLNEERVFWTNLPTHLIAWGVVPHLAHVTCNALGRWITGQNPGAYVFGKLSIMRELKSVLDQRRTRRQLAGAAKFPVRFPVETDWLTVFHNVVVRVLGLLPRSMMPAPAVAPSRPAAVAVPTKNENHAKAA